ncbi:PREDICTED: uncharacterized protein LOC109210920 [Nicotiana attenuata]|uniref:uncharacterized protein LOC109210920 n=1 Tax=Nicotiana attenuata TaxID=49451 RepID=UPI000905B135|nr:PREDICTED: uncharacterized protein LOC109210920 [Nicotiana attenuata]
MRLALKAKQKLGFVTGACAKESFKENLHEEWETCNAIVHSIIYASDAHVVWEDLQERFDKVNRVRIFQLHRSILRLSQGADSVAVYFTKLKELWAEYDVLVPYLKCGCPKSKEHMTHLQQQRVVQFLDRLNDTYDQARRQILMKTTEPTLNQAYALITKDESQQCAGGGVIGHKSDPLAMQAGRGQGFCGRKHCHMRGHTKKNCDKIVGYPEDFRRRKVFHSILKTANYVEGSVNHEEGNKAQSLQGTSGGDHFFTEAQYQQILDLLNKDSPPSDMKAQNQATTAAIITDLYNSRVKAIGKEDEGLYILKGRGIRLLATNVDVRDSSGETTYLWHVRLGHASVPVMQYVSFLHNKVDDNMQNKCNVCPLAKQSRLSFPNNEKRSARAFKLVHMDVWGPYKKSTHDRKHYFFTVVDDFSRATWIFLMQFKNETIIFLKQFVSMVKSQFDTSVKILRTDNGKGFFNAQWNEFLLSQGIIHQSSCAQTSGLPAISNLEESFQVPNTAETTHTCTSSPAKDRNNGIHNAASQAGELEESSVPNENHDAAPPV